MSSILRFAARSARNGGPPAAKQPKRRAGKGAMGGLNLQSIQDEQGRSSNLGVPRGRNIAGLRTLILAWPGYWFAAWGSNIQCPFPKRHSWRP
jgi:hypothetical protein